jgi:Met-zincin/Domain of unknown function (DUF5117)
MKNNRYHHATKIAMLAGVLLSCVAGPSLAGPDGDKKKKKKDDFPKFEDVTKDMEVKKGFYTLYYDKKKDVLLGRIPKSLLGERHLASLSIPKGPFLAGWMLSGSTVYWERMDKKLVLFQADTRIKKGKGSTVEDVIQRTYTDTILRALDIKTIAPGGDPVVDLNDLLKKDFAGMGNIYGGRRVDSSLSRWCTMKAFPDNVELAVDLALMSKKPTEGGMIASLYVSLSKLPKDNGYKPREADDRIGYFLTAQKDWTADHDAKTIFKRYIHRWHLVKQDPKAAESPVTNPIIFYIEKTVPVQYRRYVRAGILEWNKAFQKCGYLDAVQVRQQTDTNEFKDLDPEDVRYNFFRWIVSGSAFARGPSRVNPATGQILDADIVMDDSMVRFWTNTYRLKGAPAADALSDPMAEDFYATFPEYRFTSLEDQLTPDFIQDAPTTHPMPTLESMRKLVRPSEGSCEYGIGMVNELAFSQLLASTGGVRNLPEEFLGEVITEVVMHEVGHTLGLRHNFKGSSWRKLSEIISDSTEVRPLTGSVMDYNPTEFAGTEADQGCFITTTLGPYDYWAIEYGYRPFMSGGDAGSEKEMLASITSRVAEPGLAYATDEDTSDFGPDPYIYRFDNGDDPVAFAKHRIAMAERLFGDLETRAVAEGESYSRLRKAFNTVMGQFSIAGRAAARVVGGQAINRDHKGDPNARQPFVILSAAKQREALALIGDSILSDKAFQFPPELINRLGAGRFGHWGSDQYDRTIDYNLHDRVLSTQARILTLVINPIKVNRIHDAELKVPAGDDAFTVPELLNTVTTMIWSELDDARAKGPWSNRKPRISSFRRNLQRLYLRRMISILLDKPGRGMNADAHALVRMELKNLSAKLGQDLSRSRSKLDTYTLAHFDEAKVRIDKALDAEFVDGTSHGRKRGGSSPHALERSR